MAKTITYVTRKDLYKVPKDKPLSTLVVDDFIINQSTRSITNEIWFVEEGAPKITKRLR